MNIFISNSREQPKFEIAGARAHAHII